MSIGVREIGEAVVKVKFLDSIKVKIKLSNLKCKGQGQYVLIVVKLFPENKFLIVLEYLREFLG